jgi:hypothetical protein
MKTVGYIKKEGDLHYFYSFTEGVITVQSCKGDGLCKKKMVDMKASSMLILFEGFLALDSELIDRGKDVHIYQEKIDKISAFIEWGHANYDTAPASIVDNAFIMTKYMRNMLKLISDEHPMKKDLIFLEHCVIQTYHAPYCE